MEDQMAAGAFERAKNYGRAAPLITLLANSLRRRHFL